VKLRNRNDRRQGEPIVTPGDRPRPVHSLSGGNILES
jgi:hypothetical protein